jgi:hypothetical protein
MASGNTRDVRLKPGTIKTGISYTVRAEDHRQQPLKTESLSIYHKNHTKLSLHCQPAIDINPIVKIIVTGPDQRHCSTTFYQ